MLGLGDVAGHDAQPGDVAEVDPLEDEAVNLQVVGLHPSRHHGATESNILDRGVAKVNLPDLLEREETEVDVQQRLLLHVVAVQ